MINLPSASPRLPDQGPDPAELPTSLDKQVIQHIVTVPISFPHASQVQPRSRKLSPLGLIRVNNPRSHPTSAMEGGVHVVLCTNHSNRRLSGILRGHVRDGLSGSRPKSHQGFAHANGSNRDGGTCCGESRGPVVLASMARAAQYDSHVNAAWLRNIRCAGTVCRHFMAGQTLAAAISDKDNRSSGLFYRSHPDHGQSSYAVLDPSGANTACRWHGRFGPEVADRSTTDVQRRSRPASAGNGDRTGHTVDARPYAGKTRRDCGDDRGRVTATFQRTNDVSVGGQGLNHGSV